MDSSTLHLRRSALFLLFPSRKRGYYECRWIILYAHFRDSDRWVNDQAADQREEGEGLHFIPCHYSFKRRDWIVLLFCKFNLRLSSLSFRLVKEETQLFPMKQQGSLTARKKL